jgi:NAD(P)-dependent dehydrogenase (short-subunit alcohol dehydrogenase family)
VKKEIDMNFRLKGKIAVISGGSKGLGAASANALAAEGTDLFLTARNVDDLEEVASRISNSHGVQVETLAGDLTGPETADLVAKAALQRFGQIDILINSAGSSQGGVFWEIPDSAWEDSLSLKFMGTIRMMRAVIPAMRDQHYGRIINIVGNLAKQPNPRLLPGAAANAGLLAATVGLAQEVAKDGIVVLAVNPGPTRTERWKTLMEKLAEKQKTSVEAIEGAIMEDIPMNRLAEPEEIGRIVAFMASDVAANMTGTSLTADGGWSKGLT